MVLWIGNPNRSLSAVDDRTQLNTPRWAGGPPIFNIDNWYVCKYGVGYYLNSLIKTNVKVVETNIGLELY